MPKTTTDNRLELKPVNFGAAAIDIGSKMHMAAVNPACADIPVRMFGTFTSDLHDLADWFKACGVTSVAMESTGVYWIPVYEILEQRGFDVILVNARFAKNVPGRKTDVSSAWTMAQLRGRRVRDPGMGGLVQQPAAPGAYRQHPAGRSRATLLRHAGTTRHGGIT